MLDIEEVWVTFQYNNIFTLRHKVPWFLQVILTQVAGAWSERKKMFHGGSFLKLADDNMYIQNPEAQNREVSGF